MDELSFREKLIEMGKLVVLLVAFMVAYGLLALVSPI
jgi:hypothetical protein